MDVMIGPPREPIRCAKCDGPCGENRCAVCGKPWCGLCYSFIHWCDGCLENAKKVQAEGPIGLVALFERLREMAANEAFSRSSEAISPTPPEAPQA